MENNAMFESIVENVGEVVNGAINWLGQFADTITSTPLLLLFCVAIPVAGLGVGFLNRLIRVG